MEPAAEAWPCPGPAWACRAWPWCRRPSVLGPECRRVSGPAPEKLPSGSNKGPTGATRPLGPLSREHGWTDHSFLLELLTDDPSCLSPPHPGPGKAVGKAVQVGRPSPPNKGPRKAVQVGLPWRNFRLRNRAPGWQASAADSADTGCPGCPFWPWDERLPDAREVGKILRFSYVVRNENNLACDFPRF